MNNLEFKIERWDSVTCSKDMTPKPMIYIKPTIDLLNYFRQNNNKVWLKIKNTESAYDNQVYYGIVEKSANRPNYTPNFFNSTGLYVVTLQTDYWMGYPLVDGDVEFLEGTISTSNVAQRKFRTSEEELDDIINNTNKDPVICKAECLTQCQNDGKENCDSFCTELCSNNNMMMNNKIIIGVVVILIILIVLYMLNN